MSPIEAFTGLLILMGVGLWFLRPSNMSGTQMTMYWCGMVLAIIMFVCAALTGV